MKEKYLDWFRNIKVKEFENDDSFVVKKNVISKRIKSKELRIICSQMSILLDSGACLDDILKLMGEQQQNKNYKEGFLKSLRSIKKGYSIENAFRSSELFDEFFYNMIRCGENSGKMSTVLKYMSEYYERDYKVKSKLKSIMIYPTILFIMMLVAIIFIMYAVVPNFALVFESKNIKPPFLSYITIRGMMFIKDYIDILIPMFILSLMLIYIVIRNNIENIEKIDEIKCKIPLWKKYYMVSITADFSRNMSLMLKSGISILEAIEIASDITRNSYIKKQLEISLRYINKGNSISKSINLSNIFPNLLLSMIKNGEESGNIEKSFQYINNFFENEIDIMTDRIIRLIEPSITIVMGLVIGGIIIAIVMPMFDAITII